MRSITVSENRPDTPDIQKVFKRKEKKYLMDRQMFEVLYARLKEYMDEDRYGLSTVCSLYYDTKDHELIYKSIEKPEYKEKFRLRCYGVPKEDTPVFAEIKKKFRGIVYKRRVTAPYRDMMTFINRRVPLEGDLQIQREIQFMLMKYRLKPQVFLAYDRYSLLGRGRESNLRITFDFNMRYRTYDLDLAKGDYGELIEDKDFYIMELKVDGGAPLWLVRLLNEYKIYPGTYSKYGVCYKKYILPALLKEKSGSSEE
ncbi:MAG: polyphosphate polymerase domain-containing protein [Clostridia bacterium]|nr:polyphosphate polymerase domain-containing protein [Clostridia bacterium]